MDKPNIFNCATREMSQEAFIFWLLSWGDPEALTINEELHKLSRKLLEAFFNKHNRELPSQIEKYEISMGFIDIRIKINDSLIIPIQNKIYNIERPDQLSHYVQLLKDDGYSGENILPIYLQTGSQGNYKKLKETGFLPFSRKDLLNILNAGTDINNDILNDYIANLEQIENAMQSFMHLSLNEWHMHSWQGFYNYLMTELCDGQWDVVFNSRDWIDCFLGLWWYLNYDNDCEQYLQLEKDKLCFKIKVYDKKKRAGLKCKWHDRFIRASEGSPVKVIKPVLQHDNGITVAVVEGDYRKANKDGKIDLKKTLKVILEAQKIYDRAVSI